MKRRNLPLHYEPTDKEYEEYNYYLEHRGPKEPFYTFAGWLAAGNPKPKGAKCPPKK